MVSINFTAVIFAVSFIVFIYLMKLVFFDKLAAVVGEREAFVAGRIEASRVAQAKIEADILDQNPTEILKQAKTSSNTIIHEAMNFANKDKDKLVLSARNEFKSKLESNLETLAKEEAELRAGLNKITSELVNTTVETLISQLKTKQKALN